MRAWQVPDMVISVYNQKWSLYHPWYQSVSLGLGKKQMSLQEEDQNSTDTGQAAPFLSRGQMYRSLTLLLVRKLLYDLLCISRPIWWLINITGVIIDERQVSWFYFRGFHSKVNPTTSQLTATSGLQGHKLERVFHFRRAHCTIRLSEAQGRLPLCLAWTGSN